MSRRAAGAGECPAPPAGAALVVGQQRDAGRPVRLVAHTASSTALAVAMALFHLWAAWDIVPTPSDAATRDGFHQTGDDIVYVHSVTLAGESIGTLYLHADYTRQANKLHRLYASILVAVLSISFLVAVFVSWKLERVIRRAWTPRAFTAADREAYGFAAAGRRRPYLRRNLEEHDLLPQGSDPGGGKEQCRHVGAPQ